MKLKKLLAYVILTVMTVSCFDTLAIGAGKVTLNDTQIEQYESLLNDDTIVEYSIDNEGNLITINEEGKIDVLRCEAGDNAGITLSVIGAGTFEAGTDLYLSKDDLYLVGKRTIGNSNESMTDYTINVIAETEENSEGVSHTGRSTVYCYQNGAYMGIGSDNGIYTIYECSDKYRKLYPEAATVIDSINEQENQETANENIRSLPAECKKYLKYELIYKSQYSNDYEMLEDERTMTFTYITEEEFTSDVNNLTYYDVPVCSVDDMSLLRNGYVPEVSGEYFGSTASGNISNEEIVEEAENIYSVNETDLNFDTRLLEGVTDVDSAIALLDNVSGAMSDNEKNSVRAKDQLAYVAEEAAGRASEVNVEDDIVISDDIIAEAAENVTNVKNEAENLLEDKGLVLRSVRGKTRIVTSKTDNIKITKENVTSDIDVVEAVTPLGNFEFEPDAVAEITIESAGENKIKVDFGKKESTSKVNVKFTNISQDNFKAVADDEGNVIVSKYNPVTDEISAKISESGVFTVIENEKEFEDIKDLDEDVQRAIKNLASKGVIQGTSESEFSPESPITRAEIAALMVRILNADDPNADGGFSDVTRENWYFGAAGSSKRENIIAGYEDNTFRGTLVIPKVQITSVGARILKNRLGYYAADESCINEFSDSKSIPQWAKDDIALAAYTNIVIRRTDGKFEPEKEMTRGDAAVVVERIFDKVW